MGRRLRFNAQESQRPHPRREREKDGAPLDVWLPGTHWLSRKRLCAGAKPPDETAGEH
jgi:hypothetical protein